MSLINQMLQDLEKRQTASGDVAGLPEGVMPAAEKKKNLPRWLVPILLCLVVIAGAAWYALHFIEKDKQAAETMATLLPPPVVTNQPVEPPVAPVASAPVPAPAIVPVENPPAKEPLVDPGVKKMTKAEKRQAAAEKRRSERAARSHAEKPASPAAKTEPGPGRIEKTVTQSETHEQAEAIYRQAATAFSLGRSTESIEKLRQTLALYAGHAAARQLLVKQLLEQRNMDEARSVLREGMRQPSGQLQWASYLARLELDRNDSQAARQVIDAVLPLAANNPDFQSLAGAVAQRQGKSGDAADFYRQALALRPADGRSWVGLGIALESNGHKPEAQEAFRRALSIEGLSPELEALAQRKLR